MQHCVNSELRADLHDWNAGALACNNTVFRDGSAVLDIGSYIAEKFSR